LVQHILPGPKSVMKRRYACNGPWTVGPVSSEFVRFNTIDA